MVSLTLLWGAILMTLQQDCDDVRLLVLWLLHTVIVVYIYIYIYICGGNPQPEAIGHSQTCLQPESGASRTCTVCSLVNWEMTHS